mmetsp:Transcript_23429/g.59986  ORF Transcript_23429/g.59986 Transcript_23429/m.59986 type:complete len:528 (+) Transcript_23429:265-1848(+)
MAPAIPWIPLCLFQLLHSLCGLAECAAEPAPCHGIGLCQPGGGVREALALARQHGADGGHEVLLEALRAEGGRVLLRGGRDLEPVALVHDEHLRDGVRKLVGACGQEAGGLRAAVVAHPGHHDVLARPRRVVRDGDGARRHVLDHADAKVLVAHGMQPAHRAAQQRPQLVKRHVHAPVHTVRNAQLLRVLLQVCQARGVRVVAAGPHHLEARGTQAVRARLARVARARLGRRERVQLQPVVLLGPELSHAHQEQLLERPVQGQALQLLGVAGRVHAQRAAARAAPRQQPLDRVAPEQRGHVAARPAAVDHDHVRAAAARAVPQRKRVVVQQLGRRLERAACHAGVVVVRRLPAPHPADHVGGHGGVVRVGGHAAPQQPRQRVGERPAGGVHKHLWHQPAQRLRAQPRRAHRLPHQRQARVAFWEDEVGVHQRHHLDPCLDGDVEALLGVLHQLLLAHARPGIDDNLYVWPRLLQRLHSTPQHTLPSTTTISKWMEECKSALLHRRESSEHTQHSGHQSCDQRQCTPH